MDPGGYETGALRGFFIPEFLRLQTNAVLHVVQEASKFLNRQEGTICVRLLFTGSISVQALESNSQRGK